jgi:hypothetical protein
MQESVERHFKEWVQVNPYHPAFKQRCAHLLHFKFPIENIWATLDDSDKTQPITSTPLTIASTATQDSQDNTISFKKKTTKRNLLA